MVWHRIEDPADLERLSTGDLADSVWPLVRRGGKAATSKAWRERVAENIPSLCAELAAEWKLSPRLHGREVGFGEYFAAKVGWKLHQLDRQQNPHLYDGHGTYRPEQETLPLYLANHSDKVRPDAPAALDLVPLLGLEPPPHPTVALEQALKDGRIVAASHAGVFTLIEAFAAGQVRNGYGAARALGFSPLEARNRPATAALHALNDLWSTNVRRHE